MGERKVISKWYPPDFDPSLLQRRSSRSCTRPPNQRIKVRMAVPMRCLKCTECGNFIFGGTRFNAWKEVLPGDYLDLPVTRLIFKCPNCANAIWICTDPKNSDYICERGAHRQFESVKEVVLADEAHRQPEVHEDPLEALERLRDATRRETDILDALDEIRAINQRNQRVTNEQLSGVINRKRKSDEDAHESPATKDSSSPSTLDASGCRYLPEDDEQQDSASCATSAFKQLFGLAKRRTSTSTSTTSVSAGNAAKGISVGALRIVPVTKPVTATRQPLRSQTHGKI